MLDRIRAIATEATELLDLVLASDPVLSRAIRYVESALDDVEASTNPTDAQVEEVFVALANLQDKLTAGLSEAPEQFHALIENLSDRIDIFLFHHRLS